VNEYRIKESKSFIFENIHKNYTIEYIASISGFNSRSVFLNAFKNISGITPSYFINAVKKEVGMIDND
jgi:AraC-like DNA-binding protein